MQDAESHDSSDTIKHQPTICYRVYGLHCGPATTHNHGCLLPSQQPLTPWQHPLLASNHPPPWLSSLLASKNVFHGCIHCWPTKLPGLSQLRASNHPPPWLSPLLASKNVFHGCLHCGPATTQCHGCIHCGPATTHHYGCLHARPITIHHHDFFSLKNP